MLGVRFTSMPAPPSPASPPRLLVLYDGVCGLCDRTVQFLLRKDRHGVLAFAPLQGETAAAVRRRQPQLEGVDSMVFVRDAGGAGERAFVRTTGVLAALDALGGFWRVLSWLRVVPRPLRDGIYDAVAARRYRWFGKFDSCRLPAPGQAARFLP